MSDESIRADMPLLVGQEPAFAAGSTLASDPFTPVSPKGRIIGLLTLLVALLAFSTWYWWPAMISTAPVHHMATDPLPVGAPPKVAPVEYFAISQDEARQKNGATPFVTDQVTFAAPFPFKGSMEDRARAVTCLTSAAYYEAGNDVIGQQAVVQVVLNRVRHPAFPKTVCGVVFQGAERRTGCQFTFTCDGALARIADPVIWNRASLVADMALAGFVFAPVGLATHYHTDWVLPRWSPQMDKIAQIHTHLFFRWRGSWGRPAAFRGVYAGAEVMDSRLARYYTAPVQNMEQAQTVSSSPVQEASASPAVSGSATKLSATDLGNNSVRLADDVHSQYVIQLDPAAFPGEYAILAWKLCLNKQPCRVAGYRDGAHLPSHLPLAGAEWRANLTFLYDKSGAGDSRTYWNCTQISGRSAAQCLPETQAMATAAVDIAGSAKTP